MGSIISSSQSRINRELATSPRLSGTSQKIAIVLWGLVTLTSLLSLSFSIYRLNLWEVIYRYRHTLDSGQKRALRWYVWGISSLVVVYFLNLRVTDIYYLIAGQSLFQSTSAGLAYVLVNEPIWFACETFFAVGVALWVFRDQLLGNHESAF